MSEKAMEVQKEEVLPQNGERTRDRRCFVPRTDIYETDETIVIVVDMPGVDPDGLDITLEKNLLSIQGFVNHSLPEGYDLAYAEYEDGDYMRRFNLSDQVDADNIEARLKDGVLQLNLPKIKPVQKKISVKTE